VLARPPGPLRLGRVTSVAALRTGLATARTEGYERIVRHVGRIAFGFRNSDNQRPRVLHSRLRLTTVSGRQALLGVFLGTMVSLDCPGLHVQSPWLVFMP